MPSNQTEALILAEWAKLTPPEKRDMLAEFESLKAESAFNITIDMENPLVTINDLCSTLMLIAETLSDEEGSAVMRLALLAQEQCKAVEAKRCKLFRLTHPNRAHFDANGWPGDAAACFRVQHDHPHLVALAAFAGGFLLTPPPEGDPGKSRFQVKKSGQSKGTQETRAGNACLALKPVFFSGSIAPAASVAGVLLTDNRNAEIQLASPGKRE